MLATDWKTMPEGREKYSAYLASREWALLKEQVRFRSQGFCEHCRDANYEQTHHVTYARKYKENLSDLMAVCRPCHEYLSGKTKINPAAGRYPWLKIHNTLQSIDNIYFAGKITGNNWRSEIIKDWDHARYGQCSIDVASNPSAKPNWQVVYDIIDCGNSFLANYRGPFWNDLSWGHGRVDWNESEHACGYRDDNNHGELTTDKSLTHVNIIQAICDSELIFAWIDSPDCYGTIYELGLAFQSDKAIVVYFANEQLARDMWLARQSAIFSSIAPNAGEAWKSFCRNFV